MQIPTSPTTKAVAAFVAAHRPRNRSPQVERTPALCSMTADLGTPTGDRLAILESENARLTAENQKLRERVASLESQLQALAHAGG